MKNVSRFVLAVALGVVSVAAASCGGSVEQPQTQASAGSKAPVAPQTHGVVRVFGEALGEVPLRPEQRTELEKLALAADARHAAIGEGKKDLMLAIADQIEKGSIDKTALQPKIDRIIADVEKGRPDDSAALARMHAILDASQRNAFVDALEAKFKGKHGGKGKHHGEHKERGEAGEAGEAGDHGAKHRMGGLHALEQLAEDLKLTDEQKAKIMEAMKASHEKHGGLAGMRGRMGESHKALESFRTDQFDASAAAPSPDKIRAQVAAGQGRAVTMAETILPLLTPEQRKIAADKLRAMAKDGAEMPLVH